MPNLLGSSLFSEQKNNITCKGDDQQRKDRDEVRESLVDSYWKRSINFLRLIQNSILR